RGIFRQFDQFVIRQNRACSDSADHHGTGQCQRRDTQHRLSNYVPHVFLSLSCHPNRLPERLIPSKSASPKVPTYLAWTVRAPIGALAMPTVCVEYASNYPGYFPLIIRGNRHVQAKFVIPLTEA